MLIAGLAVLVIVAAFVLPVFLPIAIIGYDGPVATIESVDHNYFDTLSGPIVDVQKSAASIDPGTPDYMDAFTQCGLKFTIQSTPVVFGTPEKINEVVEFTVDDVAQTNISKTWNVYEVELRMGVTIETYHGGLQFSPGATFWIELINNEQSIFSTSDEQIAYFVQVYTNQPSEIVGSIEVYGEDQGYSFDRFPLTTTTVPQWILDGGYTPEAGSCTHIKFPIQLISAAPSLFATTRTEAEIEIHLSVMVILFGMWERVVPYIEWDNPLPPGVFDWLFELMAAIGVFLWVGLGLIGTIFIIMKVKNPTYVGVGLLILWGIILWQLGVFNVILEGLE